MKVARKNCAFGRRIMLYAMHSTGTHTYIQCRDNSVDTAFCHLLSVMYVFIKLYSSPSLLGYFVKVRGAS